MTADGGLTMEKSSKVTELIRKTGDLTVVRAVRDGMVHIVPVLIIGSFSLILQTFPVAAYQAAVSTFLGGFFLRPQYGYDGQRIGVEALLRYEHPLVGMLYPPLVFKLAEEGGFLAELEERVLAKALENRPAILKRFGPECKLSVNVTGTTVVTARYFKFCSQLNEKSPFAGKNVCIEIMEQAAVSFNEDTLSALRTLRDMGLLLAIDDFSMGQTSIHYLQNGMFNIIKPDGSLVTGVSDNKNTQDIIASIVHLARSLSMIVLAEYVDTEEKRQALHELGCDCYQGYLYSPAVFLTQK